MKEASSAQRGEVERGKIKHKSDDAEELGRQSSSCFSGKTDNKKLKKKIKEKGLGEGLNSDRIGLVRVVVLVVA